MKKTLKISSAAVLIVLYFLFTKQFCDGITDGIIRCINIIIPSLFFMMVMSDYIAKSGVTDKMSILFKPIAKILGISESLVPIIILSNIGGYPIGIRYISSMCDDDLITSKQANVLSVFCFSSGPAFSISAIGICVFQSKKIGTAVFLSILVANLFTCAILSRIFKLTSISPQAAQNSSYSITDAIESTSKSLFSMCSVIVFFSSLCSLAEYALTSLDIFSDDRIRRLFLSVLDVTNLTNILHPTYRIIPAVVFLVSFGGACVWIQNSRLCSKRMKLGVIFAGRVAISVLSAIIYIAIFSFTCRDILVQTSQNVRLIVNIDNFIPSICLIIMIFLLFSKKRLAFQKKV